MNELWHMHYLGASTLVVPAEVPRVPEVAVLLGVLAGGVAEVAVVAGGVVEPARRPQELVLVRRGVVVGAELREGPRVGAPVLVGEGEQPLGVVEEGRRVDEYVPLMGLYTSDAAAMVAAVSAATSLPGDLVVILVRGLFSDIVSGRSQHLWSALGSPT